MLEKLTYINHLNERYDFGKLGVYVNTHELRNYEWAVETRGNRISSLSRKLANRKLPIVIITKTAEESAEVRNRLYEVLDKDALSMQYGKFVIGDYYLKGIVTKSRKKEWLRSARHLLLDLTVTTDLPAWVKEVRHVLRKVSESGVGGQNLDYAFDYAFDFKSDTGVGNVDNQSIAASSFRMIFYGPCSDPEVEIGGHLYRVYGEVGEGETLTVDSTEKAVYLTQADGTRVNKFNDRYRRSYIFEPIPSGVQFVFWGGAYGIDVITYDERSEPKWT